MATGNMQHNPMWTLAVPAVGAAVLLLSWLVSGFSLMTLLLSLGLVGGVVAAVHHAEVIAHKVGEPFGTLVLALSVTIIEVALIVSMMLSGGDNAMGLARDTIFAAVMIIVNGIIGASLLIGGLKHHTQDYSLEGVTASLGTMTVIVVMALILPNYATSEAGTVYSTKQLIFVALMTLVLFAAFIFFQTMRHRDYFLVVSKEGDVMHVDDIEPPSMKEVWISFGMLLLSLVVVVLSAKSISPTLEAFLGKMGAPLATLGIVIAAIVLMPEFGAAMRAARADRLQASLNLAIGSAIASIGLTIPVVALLSVFMGWPLELGLDAKSITLLVLSLFVVAISLRTGRTTILPGIVHLCIFVAYLFFSFVP